MSNVATRDLGSNKELSQYDVLKLKKMYGCDKKVDSEEIQRLRINVSVTLLSNWRPCLEFQDLIDGCNQTYPGNELIDSTSAPSLSTALQTNSHYVITDIHVVPSKSKRSSWAFTKETS